MYNGELQMNLLTTSIIKPFLLEQKIKTVVGVYAGRFQPFGLHHLKTYKWLQGKVDVAYIATSNITKPNTHPLNFRQKMAHMTKMGIPKNKIVNTRNPYRAENVLKKYDPATTAVVYIFGAKDAGRLSGGKYFKRYTKNMVGFDEHGYVLVAPHQSVKVGGKEISGTLLRQLLGQPNVDNNVRAKIFKQAFGYFDKNAMKMMMKRFGDIDEDINIPINVGDTVLVGKFKNKKIKVKDIGKDKHGMPTINGRKATTFRIHKRVNIFDQVQDIVNHKVKFKEMVEKFIVDYDIPSLFEGSSTGTTIGSEFSSEMDDGPRYWWGNQNSYRSNTNKEAEKLGWYVVDFLVPEVEFEEHDTLYPKGPTGAVSYFPAGKVGASSGTSVMADLIGTEAYNKWRENITRTVSVLGWEFVNFLKAEQSIEDSKNEPIVSTDPRVEVPIETEPKGEKDQHDDMELHDEDHPHTKNLKEQALTKQWWTNLITENLVPKPQLTIRKKELLLMGGAYGHMSHPFDNWNLTFGDLKNIIDMGLSGTLNREDNVTEKLDGQNLMVSWRDGKLLVARNKGHIKNKGATALDVKGVSSVFKGRGNIRDAFVFAAKDLQKAIGSLSEKQRTKIFMNGKAFMNLEVLWPKSANVVDYDVAQIVFHGALEYNDNGTVVGEVKGSARVLEGMIRQVNAHIQKHYKIAKPQFLKIPKNQDFGTRKKYYHGKLNKLRNVYALDDSDTLSLYHQMFWQEWIMNGAYQNGYSKITNAQLIKLMSRWAFGDKSYAIRHMKKEFAKHQKFLDWVLATDKQDVVKKQKQNMKPFEVLFFQLGAEILSNVSDFLAVNPSKAVQKIKKEVDAAVKAVRKGGNINKIKTVKLQLDKIAGLGGMGKIVPSEGIVFKYKGGTYKFTGAFAPVNQIAGLLKFGGR